MPGNFNPRPPWGGRRVICLHGGYKCEISIHALRGEGDVLQPQEFEPGIISIHALRGEGDAGIVVAILKLLDFNPRPPWGGRRSSSRY